MIVPTAYLDVRSEKSEQDAIHFEAEKKIIAVKVNDAVIQKDVFLVEVYGLKLSERAKAHRSEYLDSIAKTGLPIKMSRDSAMAAANHLAAMAMEQKIAIVRIDENAEIALVNIKRTKIYLIMAGVIATLGTAMAIYGFGTWYKKENA